MNCQHKRTTRTKSTGMILGQKYTLTLVHCKDCRTQVFKNVVHA